MGPDLRLVPLSTIELQEEKDLTRLEKLASRIKTSGKLKDPPIVTKGLGKKLMQLDGANRISSLLYLGCSHAVVQYVDYNDTSQVLIKSWVHVSKVDRKTFLKKIAAIPGVKTESFKLGLGLRLTGHPFAAVTVIFSDGKGLSVLGDSDLIQKVQILRKIVDLYASLIERDREVTIEGMQELSDFFAKHPEKNVALLFPSFASHEIYTLLKKKVMLPQGVTRHVVNGRVLRLNYPIEMLKKGTPEKQKQMFFIDFIKRINLRFYEESTYMVE